MAFTTFTTETRRLSYLASLAAAAALLWSASSLLAQQPQGCELSSAENSASTISSTTFADVGDPSILWGAPAIEENLVIEAHAGEPVNGFPNWNERVIHEWINRSRSDPQADLGGCTQCPDKACYVPNAPLGWDTNLSRAARFHSANLAKGNYFAHDSPCTINPAIGTLYPNSCDGSPGCACVSAGTTTPQVRIQYFAPAVFYGGEIIASYGDPNSAFYLWLNEGTTSGTCGFNFQNGHRWLILKSNGAVGAGIYSAAVADFGSGPTPTKVVSGAHYPRQSASVEVWANWNDTAAPARAFVVVNGTPIPLTRRRGTATNGAWSATVTGVGAGTSRYFFQFQDSSGVMYTYPTTGSYGICDSCADWNAQRTVASSLPPLLPPQSQPRRRTVKR